MKRILVIPGDGIGPEVTASAVKVLGSLGLPLSFEEAEAGFACYRRHGTSLPESTVKKAEESDAVLFGAVTTPPGIEGYSSAILGLRRSLGLFANVRPVRSFPHAASRQGIDMVIVRENTEGLYAGRERLSEDGNTAVSERVITREASMRIARFAYALAESQGRRKVTIVHKANVLRKSCGLFRESCLEVARDHPAIETDEALVDATAMRLIQRPEAFDVILTTNLFGDILSDEASMLVGGLGLAPSANIGGRHALFEPVHGSAPDIAGKGIANPFAAVLSAGMMLDWLGYAAEAKRVGQAVGRALIQGTTTPDLGGSLTTAQAADALITLIKENVLEGRA